VAAATTPGPWPRPAGGPAALRRAFAEPALLAVGMRQRIDHPRGIYRWIEGAANARVRRGIVYGDSGLCVRRAAYAEVGGFRDLPLFEDLDLARRLRRAGAVRLVPEAELTISARRWEREGVLRRTFLNWGLTVAYLCGVAPARLVRYYPSGRGAARAAGER
jgi:GT2 family glycosyltransferase